MSSISLKVDLTPEIIREYFEGLTKLEEVKNKNRSESFNSLLTELAPSFFDVFLKGRKRGNNKENSKVPKANPKIPKIPKCAKVNLDSLFSTNNNSNGSDEPIWVSLVKRFAKVETTTEENGEVTYKISSDFLGDVTAKVVKDVKVEPVVNNNSESVAEAKDVSADSETTAVNNEIKNQSTNQSTNINENVPNTETVPKNASKKPIYQEEPVPQNPMDIFGKMFGGMMSGMSQNSGVTGTPGNPLEMFGSMMGGATGQGNPLEMFGKMGQGNGSIFDMLGKMMGQPTSSVKIDDVSDLENLGNGENLETSVNLGKQEE